MIRGAIYQIDLGRESRGHEQRGRRYGLVMSHAPDVWTVAIVIPTSTSAGHAVFRPTIEIDGVPTRLLIDQIRAIDVNYVGDLVGCLGPDVMTDVEKALARYLGLRPRERLR